MVSERCAKTNAMFKATRLCQFFLEGRCARGAECTFAHGSDQMRKQPDLYRTALCKEFSKTGKCTNSLTCSFAHGEGELRRSKKKKAKAKQPMDQQIMLSQVPSTQASPLQCVSPKPKPGFRPILDDESDGELTPTSCRRNTDGSSGMSQPAFDKTISLSSQDTYAPNESDEELSPAFSRRDTDCNSRRNLLLFGKTFSQKSYASSWADFNELEDQDKHSWSQLEEEGLAATSSGDEDDASDLEVIVKNTFLHAQVVPQGFAEKRSKSCRF